jgi:LPS sulfotransferase NodH
MTATGEPPNPFSRRTRLLASTWRWSAEFRGRRRLLRGAYSAALLPGGGGVSRLCIVTTGRAGSELLVRMLDAHPAMRCDGEILTHAPAWPRALVRGRARQTALQGQRAYGFKIAANQLVWAVARLRPKLFFDGLAADGFTFVHLARRDLLRQALSFVRARASEVWHLDGAHQPVPPTTVDVVELISSMHWIEDQEVRLASLLAGLPVRRLWYEDHLERDNDRRETLRHLFAEAGLEPYEVPDALTKQTPTALTDVVTNLTEIEDRLRGTRYRRYVDSSPR